MVVKISAPQQGARVLTLSALGDAAQSGVSRVEARSVQAGECRACGRGLATASAAQNSTSWACSLTSCTNARMT